MPSLHFVAKALHTIADVLHKPEERVEEHIEERAEDSVGGNVEENVDEHIEGPESQLEDGELLTADEEELLSSDDEQIPLSRQASKKARRQFAHVLGQASLEKAAPLALKLRRQLDKKAGVKYWKRKALTCILMTPPMNGFYNLVYAVQFSDGSRWALKVPRRGYVDEWDELAEKALLSEVYTMKLIKKETTIPLPTVYGFDATLDNELVCPYMFMEWLAGEPLIKHWDRYVDISEDHPSDVRDDRARVQLLLDLTKAMVQLDRFEFTKCGTPSYDEQGRLVGVGPVITRDFGEETIDAMPKLIAVGPFNSGIDYMSWKVKRFGSVNDPDVGNGHQVLYFAFLDWTRDLYGNDDGFVFAHTDFGPQNILINKHGRLCGLIDFDGITAVPRFLSNGRGGAYPHWLTRDQDLWEGDEEEPASMNSSTEDLTAEMSAFTLSEEAMTTNLNLIDHEAYDFWRAIYRVCLQQAYYAEELKTERTGYQTAQQLLTIDQILASVPRSYDEGLTPAQSLDGRILLIAATSPDMMLPRIVDSIIAKICELDSKYPHLLDDKKDSVLEGYGGIPGHMMAGTILDVPGAFESQDIVGDVGGGKLGKADWGRLERWFKYIGGK